MEAVGSDGTKLQHRNGGVLRLRPDGSGLEIFSTGTRNILEVAVSPLMDIFARDNTNDGGGWDVRFQHFTGLDDHGYPRLYKNFADETVAPLADYGGGSGCGACYIDEPGFPAAWNDAPYTADWGTGALFKHTVSPKGATFVETVNPQPLVKLTRPTDGDGDALGHLYVASWKGATFNWEGGDAGYIVRVTPKNNQPGTLVDPDALDAAEVVEMLESDSHRRRLQAQRALLRQGVDAPTASTLEALAADAGRPLKARVAALFTLGLARGDGAVLPLVKLVADPQLSGYAIRALGDLALRGTEVPPSPVEVALADDDARVRLEGVVAAAHRGDLDVAPALAAVLDDSDPVVTHTAIRALAQLGASDACFTVLDSSGAGEQAAAGALRALAMMHATPVVDGLIARVGSPYRNGVLYALSRLYNREGEWKGNSWGTRPDTTGPYYQPEPWEASEKIMDTLRTVLSSADPQEAAFLIAAMDENRIRSAEALQRIIGLAQDDPALLPALAGQLAKAESVPDAAVPLLVDATRSPDAGGDVLALAVQALTKVDSAEGARASLAAVAVLAGRKDDRNHFESARDAFLKSPKLENYHLLFDEAAEAELGTALGTWADAALLELSSRQKGAPESRALSATALERGWKSPPRRAQILQAVAALRHAPYGDHVLASLNDPDTEVAKWAGEAAKAMKLEPPAATATTTKPKGSPLATLPPEQVVAQVSKIEGDPVLGEELFTRQACAACHTVAQDEPQRGPYLGNIAQTYPRDELAWSILDPSRTLAQGFATNVFTLKDGSTAMGFVTLEAADHVTIRDAAGTESMIALTDIKERATVPTSMMPPGLVAGLTVDEFAALLAYLEMLATK
ncbi:hypothetical protein BH23VER1_BH23VER1_00500 [soil metagenome]